jgi:hypothetical protein
MVAAAPFEEFAGTSLADIVRMAEQQRSLPVDRWHPADCGDSNMRIARDGSWHHEGRPIRRPELMRLFARILRREPDGRYVLVTPAEMLSIDVEDAPFTAVEMTSEGAGEDRLLAFRTNVGDVAVAGPDHPIRIDDSPAGPRPSLLVRPGLEALIVRPVYYELAELALAEDAKPPGLWSGGIFFPLQGPP